MNNRLWEISSTVLVYTREYASGPILAALRGAGYQASAMRYDEELVPTLTRTDPLLVVLAIEPARESERQIVARLAESITGAILVVGPGTDQMGFPESLRNGADACVSEADGLDHLLAQVEATVRRARQPDAKRFEGRVIGVGELQIDFRRCEVRVGGEAVRLTPTEFRILSVLAENPGTVLSATKIIAAIHDVPYTPYQARDTVKVYIRSIRQKLSSVRPDIEYIVNARGFGYMLEPTSMELAGSRRQAAIT